MLLKSIPDRSAPHFGISFSRKYLYAFTLYSSIHKGSFLYLEIFLTTSSERPLAVSNSYLKSSWKPYLYSWLTACIAFAFAISITPFFQPVIAPVLDFKRKLCVPGHCDFPVNHHMHLVRLHIIQNPVVMRYEYDCRVLSCKLVYALSNAFERVNVKPRINFIKHCNFRLKHRHLEDFIALLFPSGKSLVQEAL